MAVVLAGAAAVPALAQSGGPAGDATGVTQVLGTGTMQTLFPQTVAPLPQAGGIGGFTDRVKTRDTNIPDREGKTYIQISKNLPYVNAIFGGIPEGAGLAGGIQFTTADKLGKQFELYAEAIVSTKLYRRFEVGALIGKERDRGEVRFRYTRRTQDNFFGIGPFSDEDPVADPFSGQLVGGETNFDQEDRSFQAGYSHYFVENKWSAGVYVDLTSTSIYEGQDDADTSIFELYRPFSNGIECFDLTVSEPFFTSQLPGLGTGSRIVTYGVFTEADYRDNDKGLTQGFYGYLRYASHNDTDEQFGAVSDYEFNWNQFTADLRGYIPAFSDKTSVALRFYTDLNDQRGGDVIPFYELAHLGGSSSLRGFETRRFYGANAVLFQGEVRRTVYSWDSGDVNKGVDVNFFADAGQVWGKGFDQRCFTQTFLDRGDEFKFDNYEVDAGIGVTARVSKGFAVRFDYAHGNETDKVRLVFTRGF
jgi:outer membrane protein assembly factor BamA